MEENKIDIVLERKIISAYISMVDLFETFKIEYSEHSNMFCPFHYNTQTPSAHYHTDSNLLWCYSEQRMYSSWDLIKQFSPDTDTQKLALGIIKKFGKEEIEKTLGELELDNEIPFKSELELFKYNKINYNELCKKIAEHYI